MGITRRRFESRQGRKTIPLASDCRIGAVTRFAGVGHAPLLLSLVGLDGLVADKSVRLGYSRDVPPGQNSLKNSRIEHSKPICCNQCMPTKRNFRFMGSKGPARLVVGLLLLKLGYLGLLSGAMWLWTMALSRIEPALLS